MNKIFSSFVVNVLFLLISTIGWSMTWHTMTVDSPAYFEDMGRYMVIDSSGTPHLAYGGDHLYYATWNGAAWERVTVDSSPGVGSYASLALDPSGRPHIAYFDKTNGDLKYAYFDGTSWVLQTVDSQGHVGSSTSLAIDANGNPHIAYHDSSTGHLKYAYFNGTNWRIDVVDSETGDSPSLALDSHGRPHIAYLGFYLYEHGAKPLDTWLKYAYFDGSSWHVETVDESPNSYGFVSIGAPSLNIDGSGIPHIAYPDSANNQLKHAHFDGNNWLIETLFSSGYFNSVSYIIDPSGRQYLLYLEGLEMKYSYYDGNAWKVQTVTSVGDDAESAVLAIGPQGTPHMAVKDGDYLKYGAFDGTSWQIQTVDTSLDTGEGSSLALDPSGNPYIIYFEDHVYWDKIKYAFFDGSTWKTGYLSTLGSIGGHASFAIDRSGRLHIAYNDYEDDDLRYAYFNGTSWTIKIADPGEEEGWVLGKYNSLALDRNGKPHISYLDWTSKMLKYAYLKGSTWHTETVDDTWGTGYYTSLAVDTSGRAYIAYYDYYEKDLKYAKQSSSSWRIETIDSQGNVGKYASLALDSARRPHIAYYDADNGDLKYAYYNGRTWQKEIVDSEGNVGAYASLAIDASGVVQIAYYDSSNGHLKYARKNGGTWAIATVDSNPLVGTHASLKIDSSGNPRIAYYDEANHDLKFAYGTQEMTGTSYNIEIRAMSCQAANGGGSATCVEDTSFSQGEHLRLDFCVKDGPTGPGLLLDEYIAVVTPWNVIYLLTQDPNTPIIQYNGGAITANMAFRTGQSALSGCNTLFEMNVPRGLSGTFTFVGVLVNSGQGISESALRSNVASRTLTFDQ